MTPYLINHFKRRVASKRETTQNFDKKSFVNLIKLLHWNLTNYIFHSLQSHLIYYPIHNIQYTLNFFFILIEISLLALESICSEHRSISASLQNSLTPPLTRHPHPHPRRSDTGPDGWRVGREEAGRHWCRGLRSWVCSQRSEICYGSCSHGKGGRTSPSSDPDQGWGLWGNGPIKERQQTHYIIILLSKYLNFI